MYINEFPLVKSRCVFVIEVRLTIEAYLPGRGSRRLPAGSAPPAGNYNKESYFYLQYFLTIQSVTVDITIPSSKLSSNRYPGYEHHPLMYAADDITEGLLCLVAN